MSEHHKRMSGSARQRRNRAILAVSNVCHICGHPGADEVDHVVPLARGGSDTDTSNLRPAHGATPCDTCGHQCNRSKGAKEFAPIVRRSASLRRP